MGLGDFFQAIVDTASLPIDIVKDIAIGGEDKKTKTKIEQIGEDLDNIFK